KFAQDRVRPSSVIVLSPLAERKGTDEWVMPFAFAIKTLDVKNIPAGNMAFGDLWNVQAEIAGHGHGRVLDQGFSALVEGNAVLGQVRFAIEMNPVLGSCSTKA